MKILIVLTSHERLGNTDQTTGLWLEELAAPYYVFKDNGFEVVLASPIGGQPPVDPRSLEPEAQTEATKRFTDDNEARAQFAETLRLDSLSSPEDYDALLYPGGHGPLWDLTENIDSISLLESFHRRGKPIGALCHGSAALLHARGPNGAPILENKRVTGFSNSEESLLQLTEIVPLMVEDTLKFRGGHYTKGEDWAPHIEVDGNLITGQNPASSKAVAEEMVRLLKGS